MTGNRQAGPARRKPGFDTDIDALRLALVAETKRTGARSVAFIGIGRSAGVTTITEALREDMAAGQDAPELIDVGSLDSPDAIASAVGADLTVLVVAAGAVRREALRDGAAKLRTLGARVLGVVINKRRFPIPGAVYRRL